MVISASTVFKMIKMMKVLLLDKSKMDGTGYFGRHELDDGNVVGYPRKSNRSLRMPKRVFLT